MSLAKDQIRFLITINIEAKVRRSTKSVILGKAKVMSSEELIAKRAGRETKEQNIAKGKRKHGRKRKSLQDTSVPEIRAKVARMSEAQIEEDEITPEI